MKKIKLNVLSFAALLFLFTACNSGETKTEETTVADTAAKKEEAPPPPPPAKPVNILMMWHRVADFAKWLPLYESHDSARLANGLHNFVLGRGMDKDSNMVLVTLTMDDTEKAKQFAASEDLKAAMKKAGVLGTPKTLQVDVQMLDGGTNASTERVIRTLKVKDYEAWKKAFDSSKQKRVDAGLLDRGVGYVIGDNHTVVLVFAVTDKPKAMEYYASAELKERMKAAGVESTPETFWYTVAKKY